MRRLGRSVAGQALVEFSLFAPVLMTILMGAFIGGVGINDKLVGQGAVRAGARVAARWGSGDRLGAGARKRGDIDDDIVGTVVGAAAGMPYAHLTEVIIYRPGGNPDGDVDLTRDPYDRYTVGAGNSFVPDLGHLTFDLPMRTSESPDEVPIGVKLSWQYQPGAGGVQYDMSEHAVMWTADESSTVYASGTSGAVPAYDVSGRLINKLNTASSSPFETDGCFDRAHNLLVADFAAGTITIFDAAGARTGAFRAAGGSAVLESCALDSAGNLFVSHVDNATVDKLSPTRGLLRSFTLAADQHGIDHIALKPDDCTLLYTSEGDLVKQYNVCTGVQMADFATLVGPCYQVALRNNGEVFVACASGIFRLTATGATVQVYPDGSFGSNGFVRSMAFDPDGTSFWTADQDPPVIYHLDADSGGLIKTFKAPEAGRIYALTVSPQDLDVGGPK